MGSSRIAIGMALRPSNGNDASANIIRNPKNLPLLNTSTDSIGGSLGALVIGSPIRPRQAHNKFARAPTSQTNVLDEGSPLGSTSKSLNRRNYRMAPLPKPLPNLRRSSDRRRRSKRESTGRHSLGGSRTWQISTAPSNAGMLDEGSRLDQVLKSQSRRVMG